MRIYLAGPVAALALSLTACGGSPDSASSSHQAVTQVCGVSANGPVQGVDVSVYQGNFNWSGAGVEFGYARIGDGTGYIDSTFDANWANMKSAGVLRGAYQFFEPSENEVTQANMMVAKVGKLGRGDLPAMIDVEATGGQSPATIAAKVRHWLQIVEAGTGKRPFIYTGSYFWEGNVQDTTFGNYPIWIAAYGPKCPSLPPGWNNWLMWQYSDGNGKLDHDVFNGSLAELKALAGDSEGAVGLREWAFQANTSSLWTVGEAGNTDRQLGMMADTSPSITALSGGGFEAAFQANTGSLWTTGSAGTSDWQLGMMPGTSPSIAALAGGGFEVAFQANTGSLWTVGDAGNTDWKLGMMAGTSPSIAALPGGGFEVAFEANTTNLWTVGSAGNSDWQLGMMPGTSPSITGLPAGGFEVAFQANTGSLWTVGSAGDRDWQLGMMAGTSPSIAALPAGGFEVAFQANTSNLWTVGDGGDTDWQLGMMKGTSPAIIGLPGGGFEAAFQANTTSLWTAGTPGVRDWQLGMRTGTSPSGT